MNVITESKPVSAATLEHVLATGDLARLTPQQRLEYYSRTCESVGLNPLTRPFRFLSLNGQIQLYATKDCTDQLRKVHNISLHVLEQKTEAGVITTRVRARMPSGREDEDIGSVVLPPQGDSRANALMKSLTKAKRRVTLSICGLGFLDEAELDTMPGAVTFDAEEAPPPPPPAQPKVPPVEPARKDVSGWLEKLFEKLDAAPDQTTKCGTFIGAIRRWNLEQRKALAANAEFEQRLQAMFPPDATAIREALHETIRALEEPPADES